MTATDHARKLASAAVSLSLALTGCQSAMPSSSDPPAAFDNMTPPPGHGPFTGTVADWPLWFIAHNFDAHCFDTQSCRVRYEDYPHDLDKPAPSVASYGRPLEKLLTAGYGPIRNFPPPAIVTWRPKDGTPLEAKVDIAEIFKDRLIRHNLKREQIPEGVSISTPSIILEVNDRTINVYMRAHIPTKELQKPGNRYSDFRNDLIKVYSQTY